MKSKDGDYFSLNDANASQGIWTNINSVVSRSDLEPATDVLNLLGQVGRALNIEWSKVDQDGDKWDKPFICVGGNPNAKKSLECCEPRLIEYNDKGFTSLEDKESFKADKQHDFAIIYRGNHPATDVTCLVLFGMGEAGTRAAGSYLRRHARDLGRLYFSKPFAAIVRATWDGKDIGTVVWLSRDTSRWAWIFVLTRWRRRHSKLLTKKTGLV